MAVNLPASRLRRPPRVRRDPIDISLVEVEPIDVPPVDVPLVEVEAAEADPELDADEILAALEARRAGPRCVRDPHVVSGTDASVPVRRNPGEPGSGISADQVRAWLDQVQADLRKVRARVEYLTTEQARLDEQQRLVAQLLTTSTPL